MKLFVLQIFILVSLASCKTKKAGITEEKTPCIETANENCVCIDIYDPVCGCNGKTYSNACYAECSGITYVKGECKQNKK